MFIHLSGTIYRVLRHEPDGAWVISCEPPYTILWVDTLHMESAERVQAPENITPRSEDTDAARRRYALIEPLLANDDCISDAALRNKLIQKIATENDTTQRRVRKLYLAYLATGRLMAQWPKRKHDNREYDWAIRQFYFSAKRHSLRMTYEMLILNKYTKPDGSLEETVPTWDSFRHYYERSGYAKLARRHISREGLSSYQRDERMICGSAMAWRDKIGCYQMDATMADIYLVSRFDRSAVIGRPNIVLAVDTTTQLIAGVYVGLDEGSGAVMACIANAVADKAAYCALYDIDEQGAWPSAGMPAEIITDKGGEFLSGVTDELCVRYGVEKHALPPFRPDDKGIVEKSFDLLQGCFKPFLRGNGVVEPDCYERWATDYREQAVLTLPEFTQVVIRSILHLNRRVLSNTAHLPAGAPQTPADLWRWRAERGESVLLDVDVDEVRRMALPRVPTKLTRKGICVNGLYYVPEDLTGLELGANYTAAYDAQNTDTVYLIPDAAHWVCCAIAEGSSRYRGCTIEEVELLRETERKTVADLKRAELESKTGLYRGIQDIVERAKHLAEEKGPVSDIRENREAEKGALSE